MYSLSCYHASGFLYIFTYHGVPKIQVFAPHIANEFWTALSKAPKIQNNFWSLTPVSQQKWPTIDADAMTELVLLVSFQCVRYSSSFCWF